MTPSEADLIEDAAHLVVRRIAPGEEELFALVAEAFRRSPERLLKARGRADEMLGFGIDTTVVLITPVVLAAIGDVVKYLALEAAAAIGARSRLRRLLGRREKPAVVAAVTLDTAQRARVREIVLDKCRQAGLEAERADLVADAVVGVLSSGE